MALTGRAPLLALLGILPIVLLPSLWTVFVVVLAIALLCLSDVALATPVSALQLSRTGATSCRLGEAAEVRLSVGNTGSRSARGGVGGARVPAAGAGPRGQPGGGAAG